MRAFAGSSSSKDSKDSKDGSSLARGQGYKVHPPHEIAKGGDGGDGLVEFGPAEQDHSSQEGIGGIRSAALSKTIHRKERNWWNSLR